VLVVLADARLVTIDERTVTVAHEALIRHLPRLRGWIDADRAGLLTHRRLTDAARQWDTHKREPAALYRGDFLTASHATEHNELEAAKRRTRRLRLLASGLAALTAIVAALAVWALGQRSDAQQRGNDARRQTAQATSLALASSAVPLRTSQPHISLLLALEAYRASPRAEAKGSVLAALTAARDPRVLAIMHGHTRAVDHVAFSADGRTLMSTSDDQTIRSWDARTHKQIGTPLTAHTSRVNTVALSHDARTLAFSGADNTIRLRDTRTHKQLGAPLKGHSDEIRTIAFSRDGRTLASASDERKFPRTGPGALSATQLRAQLRAQTSSIRLWDLRTHKQLGAPLPGHAHSVHTVVFSPDGGTLASAGDLSIRLWDVRTHKQLGAPLGRGGLSMAFSPDGRTLVFSAGKTIRFWDVRACKELGPPLPAHTDRGVNGVAFSPDGRTLASIAGTTVRLWDVRTHKQLGEALSGHTSLVNNEPGQSGDRGRRGGAARHPGATGSGHPGATGRLPPGVLRRRLHSHADHEARRVPGGGRRPCPSGRG
jgi:WD40 repeat protein